MKGKLADFFLIPGDPTKNLKAIKSISMVVKDGAFYFPSDVYPKFGIQPFAAAPQVTQVTQVTPTVLATQAIPAALTTQAVPANP